MKMTRNHDQRQDNTTPTHTTYHESRKSGKQAIWDRLDSILNDPLGVIGVGLLSFGVITLIVGLAGFLFVQIYSSSTTSTDRNTAEIINVDHLGVDGEGYLDPANDPAANGHASIGGNPSSIVDPSRVKSICVSGTADLAIGTPCNVTVYFVDAITGCELDNPTGLPWCTIGDQFDVTAKNLPGKTPIADRIASTALHQFTNVYFYYVPSED